MATLTIAEAAMNTEPYVDGFNVNEFFCAQLGCQLHIPHNGNNWATVRGRDGNELLTDRHPIQEDGPCYCSNCRAQFELDRAGACE